MDSVIEYSIFTIGGKMTWQHESGTNGNQVKRVVQQPDGTFWQYSFLRSRNNIGVPLRGKARQKYMVEFIREVEAALK